MDAGDRGLLVALALTALPFLVPLAFPWIADRWFPLCRRIPEREEFRYGVHWPTFKGQVTLLYLFVFFAAINNSTVLKSMIL